ncbi:hypothetical protein [Achromobacter sp.]|uniref:hypothetical protein n=1 Tax=Achromobacter sp. TaxID=134375 RepID=UPI0028AD1F62|nr:hypothetical protein [Achromobacter sp.]
MTPRLQRISSIVPRPLPSPQSSLVTLTVRIVTVDALNVRLALHRELGGRIGIYLLSVDHKHAQSTLRVQCERGELDALMHAVMCGLPQAEFGVVLPACAVTEG